MLACVLAGLVLCACQRTDAPPTGAAAPATPKSEAAKTGEPAVSSASLAGVAHDADPAPASPRDPFMLPGPLTPAIEPDGLRRIFGAANVVEGDVPGAEAEGPGRYARERLSADPQPAAPPLRQCRR